MHKFELQPLTGINFQFFYAENIPVTSLIEIDASSPWPNNVQVMRMRVMTSNSTSKLITVFLHKNE